MKGEDMTISEIYLQASRTYRRTAVGFIACGILVMAFLTTSIIMGSGSLVQWICWIVMGITLIVDFFGAMYMLKRSDDCYSKALKASNL